MIKYKSYGIAKRLSSPNFSAKFIDFIDSDDNSPFLIAAVQADLPMLEAFLHFKKHESMDQDKIHRAIRLAMTHKHGNVVSFLRSTLWESPAVVNSHAMKPPLSVKSSRFFGSGSVHPQGEELSAKKSIKPPESRCCVML